MMHKYKKQFYKFNETKENTSAGVYILKLCDTPVYIGCSNNIYKRVSTHIYSKKFAFDEIKYLNCPVSEMRQLEKELIEKEKLVLNKAHNSKYSQEVANFFRSFSFKVKPYNYYVDLSPIN